jgi:hypothetical protein
MRHFYLGVTFVGVTVLGSKLKLLRWRRRVLSPGVCPPGSARGPH